MTDLSTTPTAKIAARIEALDAPEMVRRMREEADIRDRTPDEFDEAITAMWREGASVLEEVHAACVELAKRCLQAEAQVEKLTKDCLGFMADAVEAESEAEAVAAKSREEALEEAAKWHDLKVADADSVQAIANTSVGIVASLMHEIHEESAAALRALKSSRTDSGQPPATNTDESGRATEDDGATDVVAAPLPAGEGEK